MQVTIGNYNNAASVKLVAYQQLTMLFSYVHFPKIKNQGRTKAHFLKGEENKKRT